MKDDLAALLSPLVNESFCYLTTRGRVSGNQHEIEIWFGIQNDRIYLMAGNHNSDWVLNLLKDPLVSVRIAAHVFAGIAHLVSDEKEQMAARYLLAEKYQEWETGRILSEWARTALVVRVEPQSSGWVGRPGT
jgi:deazaflavin-dependent oxidoreductase (nitroreductase family)